MTSRVLGLIVLSVGLAIAQVIDPPPVNCVNDFRVVTYGGTINLFRESLQNMTWLQARASCDLCFAGLANVDTSHVQSGITDKDPNVEVWIGSYSRGPVTPNLTWNPALGSVNTQLDSVLHSALCQVVSMITTPQPPPSPSPTPVFNCASSERFFGTAESVQRFLTLTNERLTWGQGRSACNQCFNTTLANVIVARRIFPRTTSGEYWIGSYGGGLQVQGLKLLERTGDVVVDAAFNSPQRVLCEAPQTS